MDQSSPGFGIIGPEFEIIMINAGGFRFFLGIKAVRQPFVRFRPIRQNLQRVPESCFGFVSLSVTKCHPAQVIDGRDVVGIQV